MGAEQPSDTFIRRTSGAEVKKPHHPHIRALLRQHPEGMTCNEIGQQIGATYSTVRRALEGMPDAYIDRWVLLPGGRGQFNAVWCVVEPPANCPHPTDRTNAEVRTTWNHRHTTFGAQT